MTSHASSGNTGIAAVIYGVIAASASTLLPDTVNEIVRILAAFPVGVLSGLGLAAASAIWKRFTTDSKKEP